MKKFPITIVDNFYENPELVRQFALSMNFEKSETGHWPGYRTNLISSENINFFDIFCNKLFSIFYDFEYSEVEWDVDTCFQKINSFSNIENDIKNDGWIHSDTDCIFSGVIYLNPFPKINWGTSIYNLKRGEVDNCPQKTKMLHYSGSEIFDKREYEIEKNFNNNKFIESIKIENVFNRLVIFEKGVYHGVPSYYSSDDEPRLTQVFFVNKVSSSSCSPLVRSKIATSYVQY